MIDIDIATKTNQDFIDSIRIDKLNADQLIDEQIEFEEQEDSPVLANNDKDNLDKSEFDQECTYENESDLSEHSPTYFRPKKVATKSKDVKILYETLNTQRRLVAARQQRRQFFLERCKKLQTLYNAMRNGSGAS